ncbi:ATP-binding protein [Methylocystis suflitae]|uniref:ATP-binding protein n=1 Tax=Methylocystis suflitae TaxID=2951405 RepID=UPI00210AF170|nr:ATP-binding protein [Methylocystis suflitae]MCQ4188648.1 ATP-binding protein [Methylocystis suflitae]
MPPGNAVAIPTKDDIRARLQDVEKTFTPGTPVSSLTELVGREASLRELLSVVASPGRHAFIAGGRGTGKTSMVSCFLDCASRAAPHITCVRTNCENSSFKAIWSKVLRRTLALLGMASTQFDNVDLSCLDVEFELARMKTPLLIVFDNFEEILNPSDIVQFANLMKVISDNAVDTKLILVGSPGAATQFKRAHISVQRHLQIIPLAGLPPVKVQEFLVGRWRRCGLEIMDDALSLAMELSCGLPYSCQVVGKHAALLALSQKRSVITVADVAEAMKQVDEHFLLVSAINPAFNKRND